MSKKALLMILDGWGLGDQKKDDVIFNTPTPYWDYLMNTYPHSQLQASGENVGLPDGQMDFVSSVRTLKINCLPHFGHSRCSILPVFS